MTSLPDTQTWTASQTHRHGQLARRTDVTSKQASMPARQTAIQPDTQNLIHGQPARRTYITSQPARHDQQGNQPASQPEIVSQSARDRGIASQPDNTHIHTQTVRQTDTQTYRCTYIANQLVSQTHRHTDIQMHIQSTLVITAIVKTAFSGSGGFLLRTNLLTLLYYKI